MPDESDIDRLYQLPLDEFTPARTELAKDADRDRKAAIKALAKPTLPAWAVNQLYWTSRKTWDALIEASNRLRSAHRAALSGKKVDLRDPDAAHRSALNAALKETNQILSRAGHPTTSSTLDAVSKTLSALPAEDVPPGRLTKPLSPAGFELFSGVKPAPRGVVLRMPDRRPSPSKEPEVRNTRAIGVAKQALREAESAVQKAESVASRHAERVERAEAALEDAEKEAAEARKAADKAAARVDAARTALDEIRRTARQAARALTDATVARDTAERRLKEAAE
jgi:hypothetical protein